MTRPFGPAVAVRVARLAKGDPICHRMDIELITGHQPQICAIFPNTRADVR